MLTSCQSEPVKRSPQGKAGDMIIVMDDSVKTSPAGKLLQQYMLQPMLGLPQYESLFNLSVIAHRNFSDQMKASRNVVLVELNNRQYHDTIVYHRDYWASNQAVASIYTSGIEKMEALVQEAEIRMLSFFLRSERERQIDYIKKYPNRDITDEIRSRWNKHLTVPNSFIKRTNKEGFTWVSHETNLTSLGIIIYSFDYVGEATFSKEYLIHKRDSVLRKNIPGPAPKSFMTTDHQFPLVYKAFTLNNEKAVEIRGLWKVAGDMMGGPFVSHAHLDRQTNRVIVTEGYVYAPEKPNKRNYIWQAEAILYTYAPVKNNH